MNYQPTPVKTDIIIIIIIINIVKFILWSHSHLNPQTTQRLNK